MRAILPVSKSASGTSSAPAAYALVAAIPATTVLGGHADELGTTFSVELLFPAIRVIEPGSGEATRTVVPAALIATPAGVPGVSRLLTMRRAGRSKINRFARCLVASVTP